MDKKIEIAFGFTVIAIVVVGFVVAGLMSIPSKEEVATAVNIESVEVSIPDQSAINQLSKKIKGYERNGDLPIKLMNEEIGKANPFLSN